MNTPPAVLALADLAIGESARILRIIGNGESGLKQRLMDMGVTRGAVVRVERRAPLGDPLEVFVRGYSLALRLKEARQIEVQPLLP